MSDAATDESSDGQAGPARQASGTRPGTDNRVASALDRIIEEGVPRLHRRWPDLVSTAFVAGLDVTIGVLGLLYVKHATGSELLGAMAFGFGFIALLLAHSELFTEGFLVPVTVVVARKGTLYQLLRFWVATLVCNLLGGWAMSWIVMRGFPQLRQTAVEAASFFIRTGITFRSFCLAVLAGTVITLMTRMHNGSDSMPVRVIVSWASGFVLAGFQLAHSILESVLIFCALHTSRAPFGYADWAGWLGWTILGNVVGGVGLVTLLRLVRSKDLIQDHRADAEGTKRSRAAEPS
jgi:formate/nitrite transporter FocA (FNT family)